MTRLFIHDFYDKLMPVLPSASSSANDQSAIEADLRRLPYVNFHQNVDTIKTRLGNLPDNFIYSQGDFNARVFSELIPVSSKNILEAHRNPEILEFCYEDDQGVLCAFSLSMFKHEPHAQFCLSIIRDVTASLNQREVTIISDDVFNDSPMRKSLTSLNQTQILTQHLETAVSTALSSHLVSQLLSPLFTSEQELNIDYFNALKKRTIPNQNLDDRDTKLYKLFDLALIYQQIKAIEELKPQKQELTNLISQAFTDANFFETHQDIDMLVARFKNDQHIQNLPPIENPEHYKRKQLEQVSKFFKSQVPLLQEERLLFAFMAIFFLAATITSVLLLTGVFSIPAIALVVELFQTEAIIATCLVGVLGLTCGYLAYEAHSELNNFLENQNDDFLPAPRPF